MTTGKTAPVSATATPPSPGDVRAELEHVVTGPAFAQSDRLVSFLRFIVIETLAGRADHIKESVVGVEIFGRSPGYDPKGDPIVRVQARQLRQKLRDHYDVAGRDRRVRIELPKGGYVPQFRHQYPASPSAEVVRIPRPRRSAVGVATVAAIVTLALVAVASELYRRTRVSVSATARPRSIAVLPFRNLTGDVAQEYVSDGLTESLITDLSTLGELRVASRGSAFAFKGKDIDPREASRALGADTIVEGSLRKNGDAVRVDVRLVDAVTGGVVWAGEIRAGPIRPVHRGRRGRLPRLGRPHGTPLRDAVRRGSRHQRSGSLQVIPEGALPHSLAVWRTGTRARIGDSSGSLHPRDRARRSLCGRTRGACRCVHAARLVRAGRCAAPPRSRQGGRAPRRRAQ